MTESTSRKLLKPTTNRASWVWRRNDALVGEQDAKGNAETRPWIVLSDKLTHDRDLLIAALMTRAQKGRTRIARCVDNTSGESAPSAIAGSPDQSLVDTQQVWTFPLERHKGIAENVSVLPDIPARVREKIREYLTPIAKPRRSGLCQGRIVWVRLASMPKRSIDPSRRPMERMSRTQKEMEDRRQTALKRSDEQDQADIFHRLGARPVRSDGRLLLPALVLTSDRFLPPAVNCTRDGLFSLITVTPLVTDEELLGERAPHVATSDGTRYAPLTQGVLSLDYKAYDPQGRPRIDLGPEDRACYAEPEMLRRILDEVMGFFGIVEEAN